MGGGDTPEEANSEINKAIVYWHFKKNDIITIEPTVEIIGGKLYIGNLKDKAKIKIWFLFL